MVDAAKANAPDGKTGTEAQGQQSGKTEEKKSYDQLLSEFAKETQPPKESKSDDKASETVTLTKAQLVDFQQRIADQVSGTLEAKSQATNDFNTLATEISEEAGVGKKTAERYLLGALQGDAKLLKAWLGRNQNSDAWKEIVKLLKGEVVSDIEAALEKKGEDRRAKASVRAAANRTTGAPAKGKLPDFSRMSDAEFEAYKRENLRQ